MDTQIQAGVANVTALVRRKDHGRYLWVNFIEKKNNFPEFLPDSETDISSIDTELEPDELETTDKFKVS